MQMNARGLSMLWLSLIAASNPALAGAVGLIECPPETADCSAYSTGYEWAESFSIDKADDCQINSESFIDGCRAYVAEQHFDDEVNRASSNEVKPETEGHDDKDASADRNEQPNQ
jgi:hypothetical protein